MKLTWVLACMCALVLSLAFVPEAEASTANRIVRIGEQYLGTPYSSDFNCSDYTSVVYRRATGVRLPAWDDKQRLYGRPVINPKPGDLMFFKEYRGDGPVTHVGLYYKKGYILHNSVYFGKVTISKYRYIEGFLGFRRIR